LNPKTPKPQVPGLRRRCGGDAYTAVCRVPLWRQPRRQRRHPGHRVPR